MKIKEITYESGRVEYMCTWFDLNPIKFNKQNLIFEVTILIFLFPFWAVLWLLSLKQSRTFKSKANALRFRDLYYTAQTNRLLKKDTKKALKIAERMDKKVTNSRFIQL